MSESAGSTPQLTSTLDKNGQRAGKFELGQSVDWAQLEVPLQVRRSGTRFTVPLPKLSDGAACRAVE